MLNLWDVLESVELKINLSYCDTVDTDVLDNVICGNDNIGVVILDNLIDNQISDLNDVSEVACLNGQVLKNVGGS